MCRRVRVEGNAEVIALLERWIARAKLGQINYVALAAAEGPIHVYHDFAGLRGMEFAANWGLDVLKTRIMNQQATLDPPVPDTSVTADRFVWLATRGPACFDFFAWLVMAEMHRLREKAPGPLRVGFYWGQDGSMERILQTAGRRQMYRSVIIPSLAFVGAVEDQTCIGNGRVMERYTFVDIVKACRLGEDVPLFTPSDRGGGGDPGIQYAKATAVSPSRCARRLTRRTATAISMSGSSLRSTSARRASASSSCATPVTPWIRSPAMRRARRPRSISMCGWHCTRTPKLTCL